MSQPHVRRPARASTSRSTCSRATRRAPTRPPTSTTTARSRYGELDERVRRLARRPAGARRQARGARAAADARLQRLAGGLSRRDVRRHRAGRRQHAADRRRLRLHAGAQRARRRRWCRARCCRRCRRRWRRRPRGAEGDRRRAPIGAAAAGASRLRRAARSSTRRWPRRAATGADDPALLALFVGLDRPPKGTVHSHANPYWTAELYGKPVLGLTRGRRLLLGRQAVLRLRPGQRADLPDQRSARPRC